MRYGTLAWLLLLVAALAATGCKDPQDDPADDDDDDVGAQSTPLTVALTSPDDGTITGPGSVTVRGTVTGEDPVVTVNGQPATVSGEEFQIDVAVDAAAPYVPLLAEATDESGWVRDRRTLLVGQAVDASSDVGEGLGLRLTDDGLDGLEPAVEAMLPPSLVEQMIMDANPLYKGIVDIWATSCSVGAVELDLDADTHGLVLRGSLVDVHLDLEVDAGWAGIWPGVADAVRVDMTGAAVLSASGGQLHVTVQDVVVEIVDLTLDFKDVWEWIDEAIAWMVPSFLEGFAEDLITTEAAGAIEDLLAGMTGFDLGGVSVELGFREVTHDAVGVSLVMDLGISAGGGDAPPQRVATQGSMPELWHTQTPTGTPFGGQLVLDDDALNAIGIALLSSGLLKQTIEGEIPGAGMPLQAGLFVNLFPSLEDTLDESAPLMLKTEPSVPPVGTAAPGPDGVADLHLPGYRVIIGGDVDEDGDYEPLYHLVVDGVIRMQVDHEGELQVFGDELTATLLACERAECAPDEGEGVAALLDLAIGMFVGDLTDGLLDIVPGVHLQPLEGGALGDQLDHAGLYADLQPAP